MSDDAQTAVRVPSTYDQLAERFPASAHKTKTIGGRDLTYVDGEMVVSRLNEVLGFDGWSFEVIDVTVLEDEVWARGRMTVYTEKRTVIREQAGGQIINRTRGTPARPYVPADGDRPEQPAVPAQKGQIIELNNDIKGAITDCLKKCATLVGVGLYLYDPQERREVEAEMKAEKRGGSAPKAPVSGAAPTSSPTTGTPVPLEPTPLKTKVELVADLKKGIEYARTLDITWAEPDCARLNRAQIEDMIGALRDQCRTVLAERKKQQAS